MEQYKIYVEMTDRVAARRGVHNTFFLTANTSIVTAAAIFLPSMKERGVIPLVVPLAMLLLQCAAWFWILRSYRQLSSAKYRVLGVMEERLPASPYWSAEWKAIGSGRDPSIYWPLTRLEQWVPLTFGTAYIALFVLTLTSAW
ncbi:RipA family octameric membrane protein [Micromonospora chalcea]|uniref:RipA family octameric membrane protein n=1 Tax=Micromonospora chalcea TaxID=1874 RepID=UPI001C6FE219|nr:hypothetical protein [Micromonospora chalcea]